MIIPLICFIAGLLPLLLALRYGSLGLQSVPDGFLRRDFWIYALGYGLVAASLMLGFLGYLVHLDGNIMRPMRAVAGIIGLILLGYQWIEMNGRP